jgi:hypothetical protein
VSDEMKVPITSKSLCWHTKEVRQPYFTALSKSGRETIRLCLPLSIIKYLTVDFFLQNFEHPSYFKKIKIIYYFNYNIIYYIIYFKYMLDFFNIFE